MRHIQNLYHPASYLSIQDEKRHQAPAPWMDRALLSGYLLLVVRAQYPNLSMNTRLCYITSEALYQQVHEMM
jgi:hypothetical protein